MNIFNQNYRKGYNNPYRHGVLIGNYSEDIFGEDLKHKYEQGIKKNYVSETMDKFQWPKLNIDDIKVPGNDLTMGCNSNFDLNIDFNNKNVEDYLKLQENFDKKQREYDLNDKNEFLKNQIKANVQEKKLVATTNPEFTQEKDIKSETQDMLKVFHQKDSNGLLYTKNYGLVKHLFYGHGPDQNKFKSNEYASTYQ
jgi:hypothetical protein